MANEDLPDISVFLKENLPWPSLFLFRVSPSWLRVLFLAWAYGTVRTTSNHRLATTSHHLIPVEQHRPRIRFCHRNLCLHWGRHVQTGSFWYNTCLGIETKVTLFWCLTYRNTNRQRQRSQMLNTQAVIRFSIYNATNTFWPMPKQKWYAALPQKESSRVMT